MSTKSPAPDGGGSTDAGLARLVAGLQSADPADASVVKACCAAAYGTDLVTLLLGESYHPGGAALSRHLSDQVGLRPGMRVLDVASGIGTTALLLAGEFGLNVVGVDLGEAQVSRARARAETAGVADRVEFRIGDAELLPVADASFDAVVCECALCTFPDKPAAAAEIARALRPGGVVGLTDVWLEPDRLEAELSGLVGRVACLADARPIAEVQTIIERAGLTVTSVERHDEALVETIERITDRLRFVRMLEVPGLEEIDIGRGIELARRALDVVAQGDAGYMLLTATKE